MNYIDEIENEDLIEEIENRGFFVIKQSLSIIDECKLHHFLKVIEKYDVEELEKLLPEK